jgi:predicted lysophospholipase L1 biosynthesis ABC-type transport system permease subunit
LLGGFGVGALLLAAFGLYAVTATAVRSRTRELGIRIALGASPVELYRMVLRQATSVVLVGAGVGLVGAVAATRFVRSILFEVSPTDPAALASVTLILLVAALIAAFIPARRAAGVVPVRRFVRTEQHPRGLRHMATTLDTLDRYETPAVATTAVQASSRWHAYTAVLAAACVMVGVY